MSAAESRVALLLALMRELQEVMRAENGLLRELKLARLRELEAEKTVLAGRYELELRRLRETPEIVAGLDGDARRLLEAGMREFQTAVRVNADRLAQARGVVEDVARCIARSLAADRGPASYARDAAPDHGARVVPMAFDRRC